MGRTKRIQEGARGTTISLTPLQKSAIRKLQTKRLEAGEREPLLNEVVLEGLKLLLSQEGWTLPELERIFLKREAARGVVKQFPGKRGSRSS